MKAFEVVTGVAAPMPAANVDTDVLMPKQFLKGVDRTGLKDGVFHDLRFDENGRLRPDFILNIAPWNRSVFLIVGANFGCGSSREHAVWGLSQFGVRAIIGTTFASIFADNCARNGLLLVGLEEAHIETLQNYASKPESCSITVNLKRSTIEFGESVINFELESTLRENLLKGFDLIDIALNHKSEIRNFEKIYLEQRPWLTDYKLE